MNISILVTSDVHGYIHANDGVSKIVQPYGLSRVATYLKQKREAGNATVLIENGDFIEGSPLAAYVYMKKDAYKIHPFATLLNELDYDAAIPGNHEFDFGLDYVTNYAGGLNFPYLAANIINKKTKKPYWKPYTIVEKQGVKIGIIGLVTEHIPRLGYGAGMESLQFTDPVQAATFWAKEIRPDVDILLLSYHGGTERDLLTGQPTEYQTGENVGYKLAMETPLIDGIITGHQHKVFSGSVGDIPILQPGTRGSHVGEMTFTLKKTKQNKWEIVKSKASLTEMKDFPEDELVTEKMQNWMKETGHWLHTPLNQLPSLENLNAVTMLHHIQQTVTGEGISAVSLYHGWNQHVDLQQILQNYTFPNTFAVLRVSGEELSDLLIKCADFFQVNDQGQITPFSKGQTNKASGLSDGMWQGITYKLECVDDMYTLVYLRTSTGAEIEADAMITLVCNQTKLSHLFEHHLIIHEVMVYLPDLIVKYVQDKSMMLPVQSHQYKQVNFTG